jgi:hypothetical protein
MKILNLRLVSCLLLVLLYACKKTEVTDAGAKLINNHYNSSYSTDQITAIADGFHFTLNSDGSQHTNNPDINPGAPSIPIIKIWQRRFDCHRIGICEFFPDPIPPRDSILHYQAFLNEVNALDPAREVIIPLVLNSQQTNFEPIVLYLTEEPDSTIPEEALEFIVDEDMICQINYSGFTYVKVPAGTYIYNPNLGAFGGYSIPLIGYN